MTTCAIAVDRTARKQERFPHTSLFLAALAIAIHWAPALTPALQYDRHALACGEAWRVITCHWVHYSGSLLAWDAMAFAALAAMCERRDRAAMLGVVALSAVAIPACLWLAMPQMHCYAGLSGICSALFGMLATTLLIPAIRHRDQRQALVIIGLALIFIVKTAHESIHGSPVFASDLGAGVVPVPLAHAVGAAVGVMVGYVRTRGQRDA